MTSICISTHTLRGSSSSGFALISQPSGAERSAFRCSFNFFAPERMDSIFLCRRRRRSHRNQSQVVRMAPDEERLTRRNPLDFPIEWDRPKPGRRPDIFPQFSPMKTPLPPPMPYDPPEEDEEEDEKKEEEEEDPDREKSDHPERQ